MYTNNAYLNNSVIDIKDTSKPLIVTSCGTYKLYTHPVFSTWRPHGRRDFQLLYIASGKAHFYFDDQETIVPAGHIVLYYPKEEQKYEYYGVDQTEVYWVHFTGGSVPELLRSYNIDNRQHVYSCGFGLAYPQLFRSMIYELQMCPNNYEQMLEMYLRQLLICLQRSFLPASACDNSLTVQIIDHAAAYFNEHYNEPLQIEQYAKEHHVSTSWFIRSFKQYTGLTPMQYILQRRIYNAEALFQNGQYNITEVARIVGYDNPLYFSRIFKKIKGLSPSEYRQGIRP